jgi:hypothetical protein
MIRKSKLYESLQRETPWLREFYVELLLKCPCEC